MSGTDAAALTLLGAHMRAIAHRTSPKAVASRSRPERPSNCVLNSGSCLNEPSLNSERKSAHSSSSLESKGSCSSMFVVVLLEAFIMLISAS